MLLESYDWTMLGDIIDIAIFFWIMQGEVIGVTKTTLIVSEIAIFFWIMPMASSSVRYAMARIAENCYFLLNYALTTHDSHTRTPYLQHCYFLLNYALWKAYSTPRVPRPSPRYCYFLLNYAVNTLLQSIQLPEEFNCYFLLNYAYDRAYKLRELKEEDPLLFSFELCNSFWPQWCSLVSWRANCYFLLNYALGGLVGGVGCQTSNRLCLDCYFLLNYASRQPCSLVRA